MISFAVRSRSCGRVAAAVRNIELSIFMNSKASDLSHWEQQELLERVRREIGPSSYDELIESVGEERVIDLLLEHSRQAAAKLPPPPLQLHPLAAAFRYAWRIPHFLFGIPASEVVICVFATGTGTGFQRPDAFCGRGPAPSSGGAVILSAFERKSVIEPCRVKA